jgi:hypothetical protein
MEEFDGCHGELKCEGLLISKMMAPGGNEGDEYLELRMLTYRSGNSGLCDQE